MTFVIGNARPELVAALTAHDHLYGQLRASGPCTAPELAAYIQEQTPGVDDPSLAEAIVDAFLEKGLRDRTIELEHDNPPAYGLNFEVWQS